MQRRLPRQRSWSRHAVKSGLMRLGIEIRRARPPDEPALTPVQLVLAGALAVKGSLHIVQVGANDGRIGDPIYDFVMTNRATTRIVLVEPQVELHEQLRANYEGHPAAYLSSAAVSTRPGERVLYRVRPSAWAEMRATYYGSAPSYRAPSGVTSADRSHVLRFVQRFGADPENPDQYIESVTVPSVTLRQLLDEAQLFSSVDVLQIDAEGFDDDVIYASIDRQIAPNIIHFEHKHLEASAKSLLVAFLTRNRYGIVRLPGNNWIALQGPIELPGKG